MLQMRGKGGMMTMDMIIPFLVMGADCACDIRKREIFPFLTLVGILSGVLFRLAGTHTSCSNLLFALFPGCVVLAGAILSGGQIGKGDALVIFMVGAWTDMWTAWQTLLFGSLFTAAFAMILWIIRRRNEEIPFVPFLFAAMLTALLI